MDIRVTIIIPVFNGERYLIETIESCLAQNYKNYEIILIDDCSTDGSRNIIKKYEEKYSEISCFYNQSNKGIMQSIKQHENMFSGDALLFLGQDDLLNMNHLNIMMSEFLSTTSIIHCNSDLIDEIGNFIGVYKNDTELENFSCKPIINLYGINFISSCGLIINKSIYNQVGGFSTAFRNFGEWGLWIRLANKGNVIFCNNIKAKYRRHQSNITNSIFSKSIKKRLEFLEYILACKQAALEILNKDIKQSFTAKQYLEILKLKTKLFVYRSIIWVKY